MSPLNFYKGNLEDKINNERIDLINKVNNSLKLYNKNNVLINMEYERLQKLK